MNLLEFFVCFGLFSWGRGRGGGGCFLSVLYGGEEDIEQIHRHRPTKAIFYKIESAIIHLES